MNKKIKILVCCHKKDIMATQEPYMPIHVGKALHPNLDLGIQGDNTGDNISEKNGSYCELTGMYWAWKNLKDIDIIGLCHYRRYFDFHNQTLSWQSVKQIHCTQFSSIDLSIPNNVLSKVTNGEIVISGRQYLGTSLGLDYCFKHISDDLRTLYSVIKDNCDIIYQKAFFEVICKSNCISPGNMFIMRKDMFDDYCSWLFSILQEVEKRINISNYNNVQKRIFGYMAERLFMVYLQANKCKTITKNVFLITNEKRCGDPIYKVFVNRFRFYLANKLLTPTENYYDDSNNLYKKG